MNGDPYLFGGSTKHVRRSQQRFADLFVSGSRVLDIGCGRGIFLQLLRERGAHGLGIDVYPPAVEQCRQLGLAAELGDALKFLPAHESEFDGIVCSHVIEHLPFERGVELVCLCARALSPGGKLVLVTPNSRDFGVVGETYWLDPTHVRLYPIRLLQAMATEAGLEVVNSGTYHGALPKRELPRAILYRLFLGPFHGRPNAFVVAQKPSA